MKTLLLWLAGAVAASLFLSDTARASCVSPGDLTSGITVEYSDGSVEIHRAIRPGEVTVEERTKGGAVDRWTLANGIYFIAYDRLQNGKPLENIGYRIDYGMPARQLPVPTGASRWNTSSRMRLPPDPPFQQQETFVYGAPAIIRVADCSYDIIPIESTTVAQDDIDIVGLLYLSQIGTSLTVELNGEPWRKPVRIRPAEAD